MKVKDDDDSMPKDQEKEAVHSSSVSDNDQSPVVEDHTSEQPPAVEAKIKVTVLVNFVLRYNGLYYKGGQTLEVSHKESDFLIKNNYVVLGSVLPDGGMLVSEAHNPSYGSSPGRD